MIHLGKLYLTLVQDLLDSFSEELREYIEEYVEAWFDPFNKKDWENYLEGYLDAIVQFLEVQAQS